MIWQMAVCLHNHDTNGEASIGEHADVIIVNNQRSRRVAELLSDFRNFQHFIAAAPSQPSRQEDYYTEGWAALRQCALDGEHILSVTADTTIPQGSGGADEQIKAELQQQVP